ncbi:hypothetical protein Tco_0098293 [Tanacetum coccineum]
MSKAILAFNSFFVPKGGVRVESNVLAVGNNGRGGGTRVKEQWVRVLASNSVLSINRAITLVMSLLPTFKASEGLLIVSSSRIPTIPYQMADSLAIRALYSAQAIMVELALVTQW